MARPDRSSSTSNVGRVAWSVAAALAIAVLALVQASALWQLAPGATVEGPILPAMLLDALCGALQAVLFRQLLPQRYREPRGFTLLFLWHLAAWGIYGVLMGSRLLVLLIRQYRGDFELRMSCDQAQKFAGHIAGPAQHDGRRRGAHSPTTLD